jgi:hypothetical protein
MQLAIRVVLGDGVDVQEEFGTAPTPRQLVRIGWRKNSASSVAFALALGKRKPRNLTNGLLIDTDQALSIYNRHEFHHVFPQAHMRRITGSAESANRLMNMCILSASENKKISDEDPATYFPPIINSHAQEAARVLKSNLLPLPEMYDYQRADFESFLWARAEVAAGWIRRLCDGTE